MTDTSSVVRNGASPEPISADPTPTPEKAPDLPKGYRLGQTETRLSRAFTPSTYDPAAHTVEVIMSTGAGVRRWFGVEQMGMEPANIDLTRAEMGQVKALDSHNSYQVDDIVGSLVGHRLSNGVLYGTIRFAETPHGQEVEAMVARSELTGVSIGYSVQAMERIAIDPQTDDETWLISRWSLLEISFVSVPADPGAGVRSADLSSNTPPPLEPQPIPDPMETSMPDPIETTPAADPVANPPVAPATVGMSASEALEVAEEAKRYGLETEIRDAIKADSGLTHSQARLKILDLQARAQKADTAPLIAGGVRVLVDEHVTRREAVSEAFHRGLTGKWDGVKGPASELRGLDTIPDMAAHYLGVRSPRNIAECENLLSQVFNRSAMTPSDFPLLFNNALNQSIGDSYKAAEPVYRRISSQTTFADFRDHDLLEVGAFPLLQPIGADTGEIRAGSYGERRETAVVASYGVQMAFSRQMMVNDRLDSIGRMLASQGARVAMFEELTFFSMKAGPSGAGPTLKETGAAVFTVANGNLISTGTDITVASMKVARQAMRKFKNIDGNQMGFGPAILLVSPDKETEGEQIIAPIAAAQTSNYNPFSGKLQLIVGGQLTGNAWELYVDPAIGSNFVWGLLDGYDAPRLSFDTPWHTQGMMAKLEHDFGCGAQNWRYALRNNGA